MWTLQIDLATTAEPTAAPPGFVTPTPNFDRPQFAVEEDTVFDDRLNLVGYTVNPQSSAPGSVLTVTLIWQVLDLVAADYHTFVHVFNNQEQLVAQVDGPTGGGRRAAKDWIIKEYIYDQHQVRLPSEMTLDEVEIRVGIYDAEAGQRVDIESPNTVTLNTVASAASLSPTSTMMLPRPTGTAPATMMAPRPTETPPVTPTKMESEAGEFQGVQALRVVYTKDNNIWLWGANAATRQLTRDGGVEEVWLSDDGQQIAFRREGQIWVIDSDGNNERQLTFAEDFAALDIDAEIASLSTGIYPAQVAWRPNSHQLYFNTAPQFEGPGLFLLNDLWMVDADSGSRFKLLDPGEGGNFTFAPNGQKLALVTPGRIDLVDVDGSNRREAFTHAQVVTDSEFEYYAQPVWASDSDSLRVAIPPVHTADLGVHTIWHIPMVDQPARLIGEVTTASGLLTPLFAPNLARLAYLSSEHTQGTSRSTLAVSELGDSMVWDPVLFPEAVTSSEVTRLHGWSPDSIRFLFTPPEGALAEITMGQPGVRKLISEEQMIINDLRWTDNFRFLFVNFAADGWHLQLDDILGFEQLEIAAGSHGPVSYDFAWVPAASSGE